MSWDLAADQWPARESITEHLEAGRYAEAIPLLKTTLQLQPDDVQSLTQLGMVKSDLGELVEARRLLERPWRWRRRCRRSRPTPRCRRW